MKSEYYKLSEQDKERIKRQIEDWDYLMGVLEQNFPDLPRTNSAEVQRAVAQDHLKRIKSSNIGKTTSKKARALLYDKYFYTKTPDGLYLTYVPVLSRRGVMMNVIALRKFSTERGNLYVGTTASGHYLALSSHIFNRYADRSGVAEQLDKAIFWVMKELFHSKSSSVLEEVDSAESMIRKGHVSQPIYKHIASGMLLGDIHCVDQDTDISFFKTYISQEMFKGDQDREHQEAWELIMEDYKNNPRPLPLI